MIKRNDFLLIELTQDEKEMINGGGWLDDLYNAGCAVGSAARAFIDGWGAAPSWDPNVGPMRPAEFR